MKRLALLLLVLLLAAGGAYWLWSHYGQAPSQATANQDARALTDAEQSAFLPSVCGGMSPGSDGYAHNCTVLPGYPSADYGGAGTGLGITLTSVILGHFSSAAADEAYVSYQGSFESHADDFGGGILFSADGNGGWRLEKWLPGGVMDGCLSLNPQGRAQMLCLRGFTGQGETDTLIVIARPGGDGLKKILTASDLRETMDPNGNCDLRTATDQDVLLGIDSIARAGANYNARVEFIPAAVAAPVCTAKALADAPVSKATLTLSWDGSSISIAPAYHFAPAESD